MDDHYNSLNDSNMNASQILHLALQKMDGIIATNSEVDLMTAMMTSSNVKSSNNNKDQPNNNFVDNSLKIRNFQNGDGNHNNDDKKQQQNYQKKQDKLNRLLQELKDYSKEDVGSSTQSSQSSSIMENNDDSSPMINADENFNLLSSSSNQQKKSASTSPSVSVHFTGTKLEETCSSPMKNNSQDGTSGGGKSKKKSTRQQQRQNKNELKHQTSLTSTDGNESDSTIGSSEPESSNDTIASEKENDAITTTNIAMNTTINRSLMQQQQHILNRSRTLSEPIDDYNLNVRLRAIAHHHLASHQFRSDYRASVDPYLLDEVTRNLFQCSFYQSPKQQHQYLPSQTSKNYQGNNSNYMSAESLTFCPPPPPLPGSMYSLNSGISDHYGQVDKGNYHLFQPWGQQSPPHLPTTSYRAGNYANCCRMGCSDGHYVPPYQSTTQYQPNPFLYDSHLYHHSHNVPSVNNSNNLGLYWDNDYLSNSSTNSCVMNHNHSYPNLASIPQTYMSQTNLRKVMNNGKPNGGNQQQDSNTQDYLFNSNSSPNKITNNPFFPMDKSIPSEEQLPQQQQQHVGNNLQQQHKQHGNSGTSSDEYQHTISKTEKIVQLESVVNILRNQLLNTEELFKKALASKKTLENANCDLLTIVDKLKLDQIHFENQQKILKEQNMKMEDEFEQMKTRLLEKDTEISSLRLTMAKIVRATGYVLSGNELALLRGKTIASDYIKNKFKENYHELVFGPYARNSNYFYSEPSSRRESNVGVFSSTGGRFSPVAPPRSHLHPQSSIVSEQQLSPVHVSRTLNNQNELKHVQPISLRSTSFEDMKMDSQHVIDEHRNEQKESSGKHNKNSFSTLPHNTKVMRRIQRHLLEDGQHLEMENSHNNNHKMSQSLMDEEPLMTMANNNGNNKAFSTPNSPMVNLKSHSSIHHPLSSTHRHYFHHNQSSGFSVTFGKKFCWLRRSRRTASAPELAQDDEIIPSTQTLRNNIVSPRINLDDSKLKGLKRIFSRKKSTSSLTGISDSFSRGGLRATSGPRLGFSQEKRFQNVNMPFSSWGTSLVSDWFAMIGLGMYVNDCKRWCKNGEHLMRATSWEVEKELGIKNALHRKKLRLAVASMNDEEDDLLKCAGKLDYLWVARWLDDIGLPQYKESFIDARVDGRVLHYLTINDLLHLKVTSQLHFASIRTAIRVLRENNYNGQCLKRRAATNKANQCEWSCSEVALWSSHSIMEWLRSIDLSEYAPNLRGSGVHGALILYENAFNADLFATLLSIPTNKTLLRRHISSKFKQLVGDELSKVKHEYECLPNYQPMIPGAKIRAHKKGHFTLRKKRADFELTDYVCPMPPISMPTTKYSSINKKLKNESLKKEDSPSRLKTTTESIAEKNPQERGENSSLKFEPKSYSSPVQLENGLNHQQHASNRNDNSDVDQVQDSKSEEEPSPDKEKMSG